MDGSVAPAPEQPRAAAAGCHGGRETMLEAARAAGMREEVDRLVVEYLGGM
jgi:chlorophyllide a reductase subunit Y